MPGQVEPDISTPAHGPHKQLLPPASAQDRLHQVKGQSCGTAQHGGEIESETTDAQRRETRGLLILLEHGEDR